MMAGWEERIRAAQQLTSYSIGGVDYPRVAYGSEGDPWDATGPCHDCVVVEGQLHVPGGDVERCPKCGRQFISCGCEVEED